MLIEVNNVVKSYSTGDIKTNVLDGLSVSVGKGEICAVLGPSGSGKSTLLNVIGGLDTVDSGTITIDGKNIVGMSSKELVRFRKENYGYVFQFYNLISNLTLTDNVRVGEYLSNHPLDMNELLDLLGLSAHKNKFPSQLSGGQQQRCSIARALIKNPKILLCDEPTGALDYQTGKQILTLLQEMARKQGTTVIIVTHNASLAPIADRVIRMHDAKIKSVELNPNPQKIEDLEY